MSKIKTIVVPLRIALHIICYKLMKGVCNLYNPYRRDPFPYNGNTSRGSSNNMYNEYGAYPFTYENNNPNAQYTSFEDYGPEPFVVNIEEVTKQNDTFRTALWTGNHLQLTLMSIDVGEDIGLEIHPHLDQFIRIEEGRGVVRMGDRKEYLDFQKNVGADFAFIIPAGKWHNLINTGNIPLKLYSIYAPPQHPPGTVHMTKADALAAEKHNGY